MAHGLEVRVPFVDACLLERLGPAIASSASADEAGPCGLRATIASEHAVKRPKTGFSTPVRKWIGGQAGSSERGLRGWANHVHQVFRITPQASLSPMFVYGGGMR